MDPQSQAPVDLVVIGAGWHGLVTASTHLQLHPTSTLLVLDKYATIGGVWASHRLYPGLKTNNMLGTYEFSDFPMTTDRYGVQPGQHIPGTIVHKYLGDYAEHIGLTPHIKFNCKVEIAARLDNDAGWTLTVQRQDSDETFTVTTKKLVVATGLSSEPFIPEYPEQETFAAPIVHCGSLLGPSEQLFAHAKNVVVVGGTKSAWDAAYTFATRGIHVDMVVRASGHGPCWMSPPYVTPLKKWLEKLVTTRFLTWFSPCVWGDADGFTGARGFLHNTKVGRAVTKKFWGVLAGDVIALNKYDEHPETAKLKPWVDAFWVAAGLSILNYDTNWFDLVKEGKISVHIADITSLSPNTVHLAFKDPENTPATLIADGLILATGWKFHPPMKFINSSTGSVIDATLGLPHHSSEAAESDPTIQATDEAILAKFPMLQDQPKLDHVIPPLPGKYNQAKELNRGFELYRFMVPPALIGSRTIAFNGMLQTITTPIVAQAQALWINAYLDGLVPSLPSGSDSESEGDGVAEGDKTAEDRIVKETALHSRFGKWRYPGGYGARYPDFVFDALPYIDMLLGDLGVKNRRKNGVLGECFNPYGPEDYKGLVEEYQGVMAAKSAESEVKA